MAQQPRLVNRQFNSPIGLYSEQNVQEVLHKEMQVLTNGGVGINFYNPNVGKPANLHNSAVLRMIEEEKRHQNGPMKREGTKRVAWPPLENSDEEGNTQQAKQTPSSPAPILTNPPETKTLIASGTNRPPLQPLNIVCNTLTSQQSPRSPILQLSPKGYGQNTVPKSWAPVQSPVSPKGYSSPGQQSYSSGIQQVASKSYSPSSSSGFQNNSSSIQAQQRAATPCHIPNKVKEPPPSTITLRPQAPVSQAPPPVFSSQPATATFKGGKCLRGDLKWPPETVKQQAEEENRLRVELAKGPVFRPRKVNKDYTGFFAQHALNSTYPGYRAPPGTQYYGQSDY